MVKDLEDGGTWTELVGAPNPNDDEGYGWGPLEVRATEVEDEVPALLPEEFRVAPEF